MKPWEVVSSRTLLERRWLTLREQRVRLGTGAEIDEFHLLESPDWVAVLARRHEDGAVGVVEQYRHGAARASLELPAGVVDEGETPEAAARRELREETGYEAREWTELLTVCPDPSRGTSTAYIFFADGALEVGRPSLDAGEDLQPSWLPPAALLSAIDSGRIFHRVHVAAVLTAARRGWLGAAAAFAGECG
ncbi:MAG: NUDIX hydrolase [Myxococcota bacterium]